MSVLFVCNYVRTYPLYHDEIGSTTNTQVYAHMPFPLNNDYQGGHNSVYILLSLLKSQYFLPSWLVHTVSQKFTVNQKLVIVNKEFFG